MTVWSAIHIALFAVGTVCMVVGGLSFGVVKHYGRQRRRGKRRLRRELSRWSTDIGTISWMDHPSLSKLDIADLLWERGLTITGQDHRADGWPLEVGPGAPAHRPQPREELLMAELHMRTLSDVSEFDLDPVPFEDLERGALLRAAEGMGWQYRGLVMRSHPMIRLARSRFDSRGG